MTPDNPKPPDESQAGQALAASALLACPFCGSEARYVDNAPDGGHFVECLQCLCATRIIYPSKCDPRRELYEAWNSRDGELAAIGARWRLNSSIEEWFPITAEELEKFTNRIIALELENALLRKANEKAELEPQPNAKSERYAKRLKTT